MRPQDLARLVLLAALWGASFLFMKIAAPALGPVGTAAARVLIAGTLILGWLHLKGISIPYRRAWKPMLVVGVLNSSLPFALFAFAALTLPSSYSAVLNSTAPLFGMVLSPIWLAVRPTRANLLGAALGMGGVTLIAGLGPVPPTTATILAIGACLVASASYALVGIYIKLRVTDLPPVTIAGLGQLTAGVALLPFLLVVPVPGPITSDVVLATLALAVLCSALAYLLYYRLIADCGPTRALTVTYLIPVFGVTWGALFLDEVITIEMIIGCALVIMGTMLALRKA